MQPRENSRRYLKEMGAAMLLYVAATFAMGWLVRQLPEASNWRYLAAAIPVLPVIGALWAIIHFVLRSDELMQRIQMMAAVITLGTIIIACVALGFLQSWAGFPTFSAFYIVMAGILIWGCLPALLARRYA